MHTRTALYTALRVGSMNVRLNNIGILKNMLSVAKKGFGQGWMQKLAAEFFGRAAAYCPADGLIKARWIHLSYSSSEFSLGMVRASAGMACSEQFMVERVHP